MDYHSYKNNQIALGSTVGDDGSPQREIWAYRVECCCSRGPTARRQIIMTECQSLLRHKDHSSADQRMFDLWLRANAVIGSILGVAIVAMAIGGARGPGSATLTEASVAISPQQ